MSSSRVSFVYIHGAGLDTWIWDEITQLLDSSHLSASFPGRNSDLPVREKLELSEYVDHICQQIQEQSIENAILVSHSIGGVIGLEVADELPDRLVGFVGLCAAFPTQGNSFLSCFPFPQRVIQGAILQAFGTKPPNSAIRGSLCAGLSEEDTRQIIDHFTPESRNLFTDSCNATVPEVPTLYIKTTNDKEISSSLQETMNFNINADEVATIESGHMPMLSHPQELTSILNSFKSRHAL